MEHFPWSAFSNMRRAFLPSRFARESIAQMSACVSVTASGALSESTCLFSQRRQFLVCPRMLFGTKIGHRIIGACRDPPTADQFERGRRCSVAGLDFLQPLCSRFQVVEIRLSDQYGTVRAAAARDDDLTASMTGDGFEKCKELLTGAGDAQKDGRH